LRSCGRPANRISLIRHTRPGESRRRTGENRPRTAQVDSAVPAYPQTGQAQRHHPTARAAGIVELQILVDTREQYAYRFAAQQASAVKRALPCGDYGVVAAGRLVAAVERKSSPDLVSSLINGKLRYAIGDLAALPRAAVVVEDRYSQIFKLDWVRPAGAVDGLAELQVRWPNIPILFTETRQLAEEWTYRYLAAAFAWAETEQTIIERLGLPLGDIEPNTAVEAQTPSTAEVRAWARSVGLAVPDRGRLQADIWQAWRDAQPK